MFYNIGPSYATTLITTVKSFTRQGFLLLQIICANASLYSNLSSKKFSNEKFYSKEGNFRISEEVNFGATSFGQPDISTNNKKLLSIREKS
jgi:hypothetical protein